MDEQLLAVEEIQRLKSRYCRAVDGKDWGAWRELFTDDARFFSESIESGDSAGVDEFRESLVRRIGGAVTSHQTHMPLIDVADGRARGIWLMHDYNEYECDLERRVKHGFGHYEEAYRREDDGWRIESLRLRRIRQDPQVAPFAFESVGSVPAHGALGKAQLTPGQLVDVEAIKQVKARYFRFLDTKRWDEWRGLFADDARLAIRGPDGGDCAIDDFLPQIRSAHAQTVTVHHGHMPDIAFTGPDEAACIWTLNDWCDRPPGGRASSIGYGHYDEQYRRIDGEWRIASLRLTYVRRDLLPEEPVFAGEVPVRVSDDWLPAGGLPDADRLGDLEQIRRLKSRYFQTIDAKDWAGYRALFTDDARFEGVKSSVASPDAFVAGVADLLDGRTTVHQGHMPEIRFLDEDEARGVWSMFDYVERPGTPQRDGFVGYGHYEEAYRREPDGWKISLLRLTRIRRDPLAGDPVPPYQGWTRLPDGQWLAPGAPYRNAGNTSAPSRSRSASGIAPKKK